jgi:PII-like signaling protein
MLIRKSVQYSDRSKPRACRVEGGSPVVITIVDSTDNLQGLIPAIEDMLDTGMIAMSDVTVTRIQNGAVARDI